MNTYVTIIRTYRFRPGEGIVAGSEVVEHFFHDSLEEAVEDAAHLEATAWEIALDGMLEVSDFRPAGATAEERVREIEAHMDLDPLVVETSASLA